jgi:hypothetical protein
MMLALEREPRQVKRWGQLVARAWGDDVFRGRLLAEPALVLREEGIAVPAGVAVRVVENGVAAAPEEGPCFWLPPSPADEDLIEDSLAPREPTMGHPCSGHCSGYCPRTKPLPSEQPAELRLPARPAEEELVEDELGLPPGAHNISHCSFCPRTKPL